MFRLLSLVTTPRGIHAGCQSERGGADPAFGAAAVTVTKAADPRAGSALPRLLAFKVLLENSRCSIHPKCEASLATFGGDNIGSNVAPLTKMLQIAQPRRGPTDGR